MSNEGEPEYLVSPVIPIGATCRVCEGFSVDKDFSWIDCKCFGFGGLKKGGRTVKLKLNNQLNRFLDEVFLPMLKHEVQRLSNDSSNTLNLITTGRHAEYDDRSILLNSWGKDMCNTRGSKKVICLPIFPLKIPDEEHDFLRMSQHVLQILQILKDELPTSITQIHCFQSSHQAFAYAWLAGLSLFDHLNKEESKKWIFIDRFIDKSLKWKSGDGILHESIGYHSIPSPISSNFERLFD